MKTRKSEKEALVNLTELCSRSERSSFEVRQKLIQWGLESKADRIIETLKKEKFIDDVRFAKAFTNDKIKINKWGRIKIRYLLSKYNIPEQIIEEGIASVDEEAYRDMVEDELDKKNRSLKIPDRFKRKARLYAFGNQRGYEPEMMYRFFGSKEL
ncbi:MAG: regulatory protein RecX [Bacteroidales bacterium]|jgi:regulatory protein